MYLSRSGSFLDLALFAVLGSFWWIGGWLLARHAFRLRRREWLIAGLAIGVLLYMVLVNLWSILLPFPYAIWIGSLSVLLLGVVAWWQNRTGVAIIASGSIPWGQLLVLAGLTTLFILINRGLAILDDYHNLPLVSLIAAGDVPPHFYLNPDYRMAYHYGLHLVAGSLMRIGGFYTWGAFDVSKAVSQAILLMLAWLWFKRVTRSDLSGFLGAALVLFGGGVRWLLLLLPTSWLVNLSENIQLLGSARHSGPDLYSVLLGPWEIEGGGPFPFPFAFMNGVFSPNILAIAGSGAVPALTIILMLMLRKRYWRPITGIVFGLIMASLALTAEHLFVMILLGILIVFCAKVISRRSTAGIRHWAWVIIPACILAVGAGGVITEVCAGLLTKLTNGNVQAYGFTGFEVRWPPALMSAHFSQLKITSPGHLLVALTEIGFVCILGPVVTLWALKRFRRGEMFIPSLSLAALVGFLIPLVLNYIEHERDITRLTAAALFIWMVLGWPIIWFGYKKAGGLIKGLIVSGYSITVLSGLVIFTISLISIPKPQFTYFVDNPDALMSKRYWDKLALGTDIFDPIPYRSVTLFGRAAGPAGNDIYTPTPLWETLITDPDPVEMAKAGYAYIYVDKTWWRDMQPKQRERFEQPCVIRVAEQTMEDKDFRWILDIQGCR